MTMAMWDLLTRLFGARAKKQIRESNSRPGELKRQNHLNETSTQAATETYFSTLFSFEEAFSNRDHETARKQIRATVQRIPAWVKEEVKQYGAFHIQTIPALEKGGTILAILGDEEGLLEMEKVVTGTPELGKWLEIIKQHRENLQLARRILRTIETSPGCLQKDMKKLLNLTDGHRIANLISWLEKAGKISRTRKGKPYELYLADARPVKDSLPKRIPKSHRKDKKGPHFREIDLRSVSCVVLPRAPAHWETAQNDAYRRDIESAQGFFEARDAENWTLSSVQKLPVEERPDPAFRRIHPSDSGIFLLDDLGNAEINEPAPAAVLHYGRSGQMIAQSGLLYDVYRVNVNPLGSNLIAMSKDCIVHAYDQMLSPILETPLREAPEIQEAVKRFGIYEEALKNHIRCVAISKDNERYLFTIVDEAWCVSMSGTGLWGVKFPSSEGWERIVTPSRIYGTTREIEEALALMNLSFPLTAQEIKRRYRELAKQWHPDLNRDDPKAEERMKSLIAAAELLTGIDASSLSPTEGSYFAKNITHPEFDVGEVTISFSVQRVGSETQAADWIYAASFAGQSKSVFIASYSGNVVIMDEEGNPKYAYNIGAVPRRIVDTGDYLYMLTDTRLYVLKDDALYSVIDVYDAGELVVAQTGFGLLEKKQFRWFREDGEYHGRIITKDPIRRVYYKDGLVVETRQRRVTVKGVPSWWEK